MIPTLIQQSVLVFKTNITTMLEKSRLQSVLNRKEIVKWNLDLDDCDRILRIITSELSSLEVMSLVKKSGIDCTELQ